MVDNLPLWEVADFTLQNEIYLSIHRSGLCVFSFIIGFSHTALPVCLSHGLISTGSHHNCCRLPSHMTTAGSYREGPD